MFSLLNVPDEKLRGKLIKTAEERVTSVKQELGGLVPVKTVIEAMKLGFTETFGTVLKEGRLTQDELAESEQLKDEKYGSEGYLKCR